MRFPCALWQPMFASGRFVDQQRQFSTRECEHHKSSQRAAGRTHLSYSPSQERGLQHSSIQEGTTRIFLRSDVFVWPEKEDVKRKAHIISRPHERKFSMKSRSDKS